MLETYNFSYNSCEMAVCYQQRTHWPPVMSWAVTQGLKLKELSAWNNSQLLRSNGFCWRFCRNICAGRITACRHVAFSHKARTWLTFIQRGKADPSSRWSLNATHISFRHLCPLAFPHRAAGRLLLSMHRANPADLNYSETALLQYDCTRRHKPGHRPSSDLSYFPTSPKPIWKVTVKPIWIFFWGL